MAGVQGLVREVKLCPTQQTALDGLLRVLPRGSVFVLWGGAGKGKTTVLPKLHDEVGGALLSMRDFIGGMTEAHPLALEETFEELVMSALSRHEYVFFDDLHVLEDVPSCSYTGRTVAPTTAKWRWPR